MIKYWQKKIRFKQWLTPPSFNRIKERCVNYVWSAFLLSRYLLVFWWNISFWPYFYFWVLHQTDIMNDETDKKWKFCQKMAQRHYFNRNVNWHTFQNEITVISHSSADTGDKSLWLGFDSSAWRLFKLILVLFRWNQ